MELFDTSKRFDQHGHNFRLELATMRFLENGENIVFLGPPGVGKTHLATALGLAAAEHRCSTYYINCHHLIEQLKKAHYENRLPDRPKVLGSRKR